MAAFTTTPTPAGEGPSLLGIAKSIGAKIRDAAESAKEEKEKAVEAGESPKKGSLFKSALANQFNPIKSKKAKGNWNKQFSWNKKSDKPDAVNGKPTGSSGGEGKTDKLKNFIAGGFSAILADTSQMVSKLSSINSATTENLGATSRSAATLVAIKETVSTQTDLKRKQLEDQQRANAEKQLEKTKQVGRTFDQKKSGEGEDQSGSSDEGGGGNGPWDWILGALGIADLAENFLPFLEKLNPFKKSPVTQGGGGKPPGFRMPGTSPRVTTSGGATAPGGFKMPGMPNGFKMPGMPNGFKMPGMPKGAGGVLGKLAAPLMVLDLYNQTKEVFNPDDNILTSLGDLGSSIYNVFQTDPNKKNLYDVRGEGPQADRARKINQQILIEREKYNNVLLNTDRTQASEGGIVPFANGGIVDNPTKTVLNPGDSVIPLNRSAGKEILGGKTNAKELEDAQAIPFKAVGATLLGISSRMLKASDSGIAGDMVRQDISSLSRTFGIANLSTTTSLGRAQFPKQQSDKKAQEFLMKVFEKMNISGGKGGEKEKDKGGDGNPPGGTPESLKGDLEADIGKDASQMKEEIMQSGATGIVDPTQQPWCAAYVNSQLKRQGIQGSGSALADSFENWGAPVDKNNIRYGDVIVGDYGGGSRSHVMFAAGSPKDGAVEIIGGNQSGKVTRGSIALDKIDYVRRAGSQPPALPTQRNNGQPVTPPSTPTPQPPANPTNKPQPLPEATVSPIYNWNNKESGGVVKAQDGMVGPSWLPWNWGKLVDQQRNTNSGLGYNAKYKDVTDPEMRRMMGLPPLKGYASGGSMDARRAHAAKLKAQRASAQRSRLGVQKVNGKWVNMGVSDRAVGNNPWWQVWNKKGATAERKAKQEALAKALAAKLNKQEGNDRRVAPAAPRPAAAPRAAARPASSGSSSGKPSSAVVNNVMATQTAPSSSSSSASTTAPGGLVSAGRTRSMGFADFLYEDLV